MKTRRVPTIRFLHPGDSVPSGGNRFNRRIIAAARRDHFPLSARRVDAGEEAEGSSSLLQESRGSRTERAKPLLLWDSLLMPRLAASAERADGRRQALLMHYLPSMEPGLDGTSRRQLRHTEDRAAERVCFFLATGQGLAAVLRERYPEIPSFVCEPGVDAVFSRVRRGLCARPRGGPVNLLSVANLIPAKGYRELLSLLGGLSSRRWCWHIAGSGAADPAFCREFMSRAAPWLGQGRIVLHGVLAPRRLARLMSWMDGFVSASYFESYGIALAEAVAAGLPVLAAEVGEARRIVGVGAGVRLVPAGAWSAFAAGLREIIDELDALPVPMNRKGATPVRSWADAFADFSAACRAGSELVI